VTSYLTEVYPDLLWLAVAAAALAWYLLAVATLEPHGKSWPVYRTASWAAGCLVLTLVTSGGPAMYAKTSFSAHMLQHLSLLLLVPLLLVLGAPITLALRTLPTRADRSVGLRETLLMVLHSRALGALRDPVAAVGLVAAGVLGFYYVTGVYQVSLFTHTGHVLTTVYLLGAGCLFVWVLLGADLGQTSSVPPLQLRLLTLVVTGILLAVFGVTLQSSDVLLAWRWWDALGRVDQATLLHDQRLGAQLTWVTGGLLLLVAAGAFAFRGRERDAENHRPLRQPRSVQPRSAPAGTASAVAGRSRHHA
jgi:putative copper resistance protein D